MQTTERLTRDEDAALRRLHFFELFGASLAPAYKELKISLLERDLRHTIREPFEIGVLQAA